jgi:hypothetical protein
VDDHLVQALAQQAVDLLVTEDIRLTRKVNRIVGAERVLSVSQAIALIRELSDVSTSSPPAVENIEAYTLDNSDPIWDSFRADYPGFDEWLQKCRREHRTTLVIRSESTTHLVGVAILNHETAEPRGAKTLKICSFKVSEELNGKRLGELLLKAVFKFAWDNRFDSLFVTTFPKHVQLLGLLTDLGFVEEESRLQNGELQLSKQLKRQCINDPSRDALTYHIADGPFSVNLACDKFVVPIQPQYHAMLFPELQAQPALMPSREGHANAIRKAYLCHSQTRTLPPGSLLMFYKSGGQGNINCLGVVESILRSNSAEAITSFVIPRTVYSEDQIRTMAQKEVLAIRFRQCLTPIEPAITILELRANGAISSAPQSIVKSKEGSREWLNQRLAGSH